MKEENKQEIEGLQNDVSESDSSFEGEKWFNFGVAIKRTDDNQELIDEMSDKIAGAQKVLRSLGYPANNSATTIKSMVRFLYKFGQKYELI